LPRRTARPSGKHPQRHYGASRKQWSEALFESECNAGAGWGAIPPITHDLPDNCTLFVEFERQPRCHLRRVVIVAGVERISIAKGNDVPGHTVIEIEISADAQNVIREFSAGVLPPTLAEPATPEHGKSEIDRNTIANRPFQILTGAIAKCSVAVLKRAAKNQSIRERMRTVELVLRVFRVGEITRIAIRREEHTDAVAVGGGSAHRARERGGEHKRGRKIPQQSLWRCHDWVSRDMSVWDRSPLFATKVSASSIKAGRSKSGTDAEFNVGCGFMGTAGALARP
jgi:hypothetical protein